MPSSEATARARQVHDQLRPADHRQSDDWRDSCSACDAIASALDEFAAAYCRTLTGEYLKHTHSLYQERDAAVARAEAAEQEVANLHSVADSLESQLREAMDTLLAEAGKRKAAERRVAELEAGMRKIASMVVKGGPSDAE